MLTGKVDAVRALVRPAITAGAVITIAALLFVGRFDEAKWFSSVIGTPVILWWFLDRSLQKRQP